MVRNTFSNCFHTLKKFVIAGFLVISAYGQIPDPVDYAKTFLNVRESQGFNRDPNIDRWNKFTGATMGSPYCASFVSWVYFNTGYKAPVSAWSPDFFTDQKHLIPFSEIKRNDAVGFYFSSKGRVAHVGLIEGLQGAYTVTLEANTSADKGQGVNRDGDGVFRKFRNSKLLSNPRNKFSRWYTK